MMYTELFVDKTTTQNCKPKDCIKTYIHETQNSYLDVVTSNNWCGTWMKIPTSAPARFKNYQAIITTYSGVTKVSSIINNIIISRKSVFCTATDAVVNIVEPFIKKIANGVEQTFEVVLNLKNIDTCFDMITFPLTLAPNFPEFVLKQNTI